MLKRQDSYEEQRAATQTQNARGLPKNLISPQRHTQSIHILRIHNTCSPNPFIPGAQIQHFLFQQPRITHPAHLLQIHLSLLHFPIHLYDRFRGTEQVAITRPISISTHYLPCNYEKLLFMSRMGGFYPTRFLNFSRFISMSLRSCRSMPRTVATGY